MTDAQKAEAGETPISVTYHGDTYTFVPAELSLAALEAIDAQKYTVALRLILGDTQYEKYRDANPLARDLNGFMVAIMAASGNRSASPVS